MKPIKKGVLINLGKWSTLSRNPTHLIKSIKLWIKIMNLGSLCNSTEDYDKIDLDAHLNPSFCSIVISTRLVLLIFAFVFLSFFLGGHLHNYFARSLVHLLMISLSGWFSSFRLQRTITPEIIRIYVNALNEGQKWHPGYTWQETQNNSYIVICVSDFSFFAFQGLKPKSSNRHV